MENVVRDARNGYGARYVMVAAGFPFALFGMGICCTLAGWLFVAGQWKTGLAITGGLLGFASIVAWYVYMLM
jgi:hypothetical protein